MWLTLLFLISSSVAQADQHAWIRHARSLSGESDRVRSRAIASLRKTAALTDALRVALREGGMQRAYALDVVSALGLKDFCGDLIEVSKKDETGSSYLVLLQLYPDRVELGRLFENRLEDGDAPVVARMVLVDALQRMRHPLPESTVRRLLDPQTDADLRSAALYYVRGLVKQRDFRYLPLAQKWWKHPANSKQFETQLKFLMGEVASLK